MNAHAELNPSIFSHAGIALDHVVLNRDRAAHRVDDAAELTNEPVASALDGAPMMRSDRRIDQIVAQRPQPRQRSLLVRPGEPTVTDGISDQDRSDLPRFHHYAAPGFGDVIMNGASALSRGARDRRQQSRQFTNVTCYFSHTCSTVGGTQLQKNEPKQLKCLRRAQNRTV